MITLAAKAAKAGRRGGSRKVRRKASNSKRFLSRVGMPKKGRWVRKRAVKGWRARRAWYLANAPRIRAKGRKYVKNNKSRIYAQVKRWRRKTNNGKNPLYKQGHPKGRRPRWDRHPRMGGKRRGGRKSAKRVAAGRKGGKKSRKRA